MRLEMLRELGKKAFTWEDKENDHDRYEERDRLMGLNRFIAKRKNFTKIFIGIAVITLLIINYLIAVFKQTGNFIKGEEISYSLLQLFSFSFSNLGIYLIVLILLIIAYIKVSYDIRMSHKDLNVGQKGTSRWTRREELEAQFPKVPEK